VNSNKVYPRKGKKYMVRILKINISILTAKCALFKSKLQKEIGN
jgi:hypothetical protein